MNAKLITGITTILLAFGALAAEDWINDAARAGKLELVQRLLEKGANVNEKDSNGLTVLHYAALGGSTQIVSLLISKGAEVESKDKTYGFTPFASAVQAGHFSVAKLLLDKGAEINTKTSQGITPMHVAAKFGNASAIQFLIENKSHLSPEDKNKITPMMMALLNKKFDAARRIAAENGYEIVETTKEELISDEDWTSKYRSGEEPGLGLLWQDDQQWPLAVTVSQKNVKRTGNLQFQGFDGLVKVGNAFALGKCEYQDDKLKYSKGALFVYPKVKGAAEKVSLEKALKTAEAGNAQVQTGVGLHYAGVLTNMIGNVPTNNVEASKWLLRAAKQGDHLAQLYIGSRFLRAEGVVRDGTQAYKWLTLATKSENRWILEEAAKNLGYCEATLKAEQIADAKLLASQFTPIKEGAQSQGNQQPIGAVKKETERPFGSLPPDTVGGLSFGGASILTYTERGETRQLNTTTLTNWPKYGSLVRTSPARAGAKAISIRNSSDNYVLVGLRYGASHGHDFIVPPKGEAATYVALKGRYEIYFKYLPDLESLHQGDSFEIADKSIDIELVRRIDGNFSIRKIK